MKAVGQFAGGINSYNAGKYTRAVMATNGQNALNAGVSEDDAIRQRAGMVIGQQRVAQGGSGFQTGTGTALDMLKQSATNRELDLLTTRMKAANQAADFQQRGAIAYSQGKSALAGGIISGAATIAQEVAGAFAGGAGGGGDAGGGDSFGTGFTTSGGMTSSTVMGDSGLGDSFTVGGFGS